MHSIYYSDQNVKQQQHNIELDSNFQVSNSKIFLKKPGDQELVISILQKDFKNENDIDTLKEQLQHIDFIQQMQNQIGEEYIYKLLNELQLETVGQFEQIKKCEEINRFYYIILKGQAYILNKIKETHNEINLYSKTQTQTQFENEQLIQQQYPDYYITNELNPGDSFGYNNLPYLIICKEKECKLGVVSKQVFKKIISQHEEDMQNQKIQFYNQIQIFSNLDNTDLVSLIEFFKDFLPKKNQIIYKEGDQADYIYVIKSGEIELSCLINFGMNNSNNTIDYYHQIDNPAQKNTLVQINQIDKLIVNSKKQKIKRTQTQIKQVVDDSDEEDKKIHNNNNNNDEMVVQKSNQKNNEQKKQVKRIRTCILGQYEMFGAEEVLQLKPRETMVRCINSSTYLYRIKKEIFFQYFRDKKALQEMLNLVKQRLEWWNQKQQQASIVITQIQQLKIDTSIEVQEKDITNTKKESKSPSHYKQEKKQMIHIQRNLPLLSHSNVENSKKIRIRSLHKFLPGEVLCNNISKYRELLQLSKDIELPDIISAIDPQLLSKQKQVFKKRHTTLRNDSVIIHEEKSQYKFLPDIITPQRQIKYSTNIEDMMNQQCQGQIFSDDITNQSNFTTQTINTQQNIQPNQTKKDCLKLLCKLGMDKNNTKNTSQSYLKNFREQIKQSYIHQDQDQHQLQFIINSNKHDSINLKQSKQNQFQREHFTFGKKIPKSYSQVNLKNQEIIQNNQKNLPQNDQKKTPVFLPIITAVKKILH